MNIDSKVVLESAITWGITSLVCSTWYGTNFITTKLNDSSSLSRGLNLSKSDDYFSSTNWSGVMEWNVFLSSLSTNYQNSSFRLWSYISS